MVARDQHRIVVISPFELRLKPRVVLDHEQSTLFGPRPTHRQPAFPISNAPIPCAPASACGKRSAKLLPFPGSLVTSIVPPIACRSEEHTSELQSLMRISYAVFCLKKKNKNTTNNHSTTSTDNTK